MIPLILRILGMLAAGALLASFLVVRDTALLDGAGVQLLSIVAGVAVAGAFFFFQGATVAAERAIEILDVLSKRAGLSPLSDVYKQSIRDRYKGAKIGTYRNAVAILIYSAVYGLVLLWWRMDIPVASWPSWVHYSKCQAVHTVAFACFGAVLYCTYDIISTCFSTVQASEAPPDSSRNGPRAP